MATAQTRKEIYAEIQEAFGQVPGWMEAMPDGALGPFWRMQMDFFDAETLIPKKYKELMGIAVSGATRCKYCALFHTEAARLAGATDAEIREASMVAAHTMMGSTFLNALQYDYDAFARETKQIVEYVKKQEAAKKRRPGEAHA